MADGAAGSGFHRADILINALTHLFFSTVSLTGITTRIPGAPETTAETAIYLNYHAFCRVCHTRFR
ncbi:hypothetical protein C5974_19605 [Cronobacter sakazakii]|nr:hypothetical protein C5974_19605 [Cronobacter sakazakii]PRV91559.1 hypothetical protein C6K71_21040 [Cronobacter sakazakii]